MYIILFCFLYYVSFFLFLYFFFFNDTATTEIYTLSLHDALPISFTFGSTCAARISLRAVMPRPPHNGDRKSTRLNSSHSQISYAVFCLKKKKKKKKSRSQTPKKKQQTTN